MSDLSSLSPGVWNIDQSHSLVGFTVRHLMISKVRGSFHSFSGAITVADKIEDSKVEVSIDLKSVSTGDATRDGHLLSADIFNVEANPAMTFVSTGIESHGAEGKMHGTLTVNGVSKPVTLDVEFGGVGSDPWGGTRVGFTASTEITRKEWGIDFNIPLDTGGMVIGDKVKIDIEIEAVKA